MTSKTPVFMSKLRYAAPSPPALSQRARGEDREQEQASSPRPLGEGPGVRVRNMTEKLVQRFGNKYTLAAPPCAAGLSASFPPRRVGLPGVFHCVRISESKSCTSKMRISRNYARKLSRRKKKGEKELLKANDLSKVQQIWLLHLSDGNSDEKRFKREIQELTGKPTFIAGVN